MSGVEVTVVRVYLREGDKGLKALLRFLHDDSSVRGVTMFRGVMGYGADHEVHGASLLDLSLDMPVIVEFFDEPERARALIAGVGEIVDPWHVVSWAARIGPVPAGD